MFIPQLANRSVLRPGATSLDQTEPAARPITIRHLMSHSSGLSYGLFDPDNDDGCAGRPAAGLSMRQEHPDQLPEALEYMHGGFATLAQSLPVRETFDGKTVWEGVVHMFDLAGYPSATRAYAWSSPMEGSAKRRFFAVLHQPPVDSPQAAVRAAIVAERRAAT